MEREKEQAAQMVKPKSTKTSKTKGALVEGSGVGSLSSHVAGNVLSQDI